MSNIRRTGNFSAKATTSTTAETITFGSGDIPGSGVTQYSFDMTGTNQDFDSLDAVRVKAGGVSIVDLNELQLAALIQRSGKKAGPGATATRFTIPLYALGSYEEGLDIPRYDCGFPQGMAPTCEIDKDNTASVGTIFASYAQSMAPFRFYPMHIRQQNNNAASPSNASSPLTQKGFLRGITFPRTTSITSVRVVVAGQELLNLRGPALLEIQEHDQGGTVTLNETILFEPPFLPMTPGNSLIFWTGDSSWAATDQFVVHSFVPQGQ